MYEVGAYIVCGPGSSSGKTLDYGLDGPSSIPGIEGVEISPHSFVSRLVQRQPSVGLATLPLPNAIAVYM